MKIILSRKGFDSRYGGQPSPILPDGTLLSLPIPYNNGITFSKIHFNGQPYLNIIKELNPKTTLNELSTCHLDPDLRYSTIKRSNGWKAAFGQAGAPLTELYKNGIGIGDIFLFFGWFRETELSNGKLRYKSGAPDLHIIYGYMQVGQIVKHKEDIPEWLEYHPHANLDTYNEAWEKQQNAIFLPTDKLSICKSLNGVGTFKFSPTVVLTAPNMSRSRWHFPKAMYGTLISHNPNGWKDGYFQSAGRGQEFIMDYSKAVEEWVGSLFNSIL